MDVDIKKAVQDTDINCATYLGSDYAFTPIQNDSLTSYKGGEKVLRGLHAAGTNAGLFASVLGTTFQNIRMVNATVTGTGSAGALAGTATNAAFDNCRVCWEREATTLRNMLTDENGDYCYQITGGYAGGLVGQMNGGSITNCLAATLVDGETVAGGLVGQATNTAEIKNTYADCYLTGKGNVGGLVGAAEPPPARTARMPKPPPIQTPSPTRT